MCVHVHAPMCATGDWTQGHRIELYLQSFFKFYFYFEIWFYQVATLPRLGLLFLPQLSRVLGIHVFTTMPGFNKSFPQMLG